MKAFSSLFSTFAGNLPESPLQGSRNTESFDCVVVRFADGHFAQDDKLIRLLFVAEGINRIEVGGLKRGIDAEEQTHAHGAAHGENNRPERDRRGQAGQ
jgi:hypothetical protein